MQDALVVLTSMRPLQNGLNFALSQQSNKVAGRPMKRVSRRHVLAGGLAISGAAVWRPRPARATTKIRVLTNWFAEPEHGGLYHAVAAGLYQKAGLDVELKQGGPALNVMQLLAGGEADVVMSYDIQIMNAFEKGVPVQAIFTSFQFDLIGLLTRPDVNSLADLKGHKIYFAGSGNSTYWPWLKKKYGYTDDMAGPKGQNLQTFITDPTSAVAGYITSEPYVAEKQNLPTKFFLFADEGYPSYANTMATTNDFIASNHDAMASFTRASIEGWKAYMADPSVGNDLIKTTNPKMDDGQINFGLKKIREVKAIESGDAATMGIGTITPERWQKTRDFLVEANLLKESTDTARSMTTEFIKNVKIFI
jgi:NitT/TauT family transport system substrate-binding protein